MDKEEGERFFIFIFISIIQWITQRADCHLDSAGKEKDQNSQSTFTQGRVTVVFTRRAVSRISGRSWEIDHLVN
jgi:hypothetical protein